MDPSIKCVVYFLSLILSALDTRTKLFEDLDGWLNASGALVGVFVELGLPLSLIITFDAAMPTAANLTFISPTTSDSRLIGTQQTNFMQHQYQITFCAQFIEMPLDMYFSSERGSRMEANS